MMILIAAVVIIKSLYGKYIEEREQRDIIENDSGFASYSFVDNMCYIIDVYVIPEKRISGMASNLCDQVCEIARRRGCGKIVTSVDPKTNGASGSMQVILKYGFKVFHTDGTLVWFEKELY